MLKKEIRLSSLGWDFNKSENFTNNSVLWFKNAKFENTWSEAKLRRDNRADE